MSRLVSLERMQDAIETYARANLREILDLVAELSPSMTVDGAPLTVPLDLPVEYLRAFSADMFLVSQFPTLVIKAWGIRRTAGTDQPGYLHTGLFEAQAELQWWAQHETPEILERILSRTGAAMMMLLSAVEEHMRPFEIDAASFDIAGIDVPGSTAHARATSLGFRVRFKV